MRTQQASKVVFKAIYIWVSHLFLYFPIYNIFLVLLCKMCCLSTVIMTTVGHINTSADTDEYWMVG